MEEQLITFKTAKLAKEKGFDGICYNYIIKHKFLTKSTIKGIKNSDFSLKNQLLNRGYFTIPTQSLLQKWLRETHKLHIKIEDWELQKWYYSLKDGRVSPVSNIIIKNSPFEFKTYEKALEKGLQEALKLIK